MKTKSLFTKSLFLAIVIGAIAIGGFTSSSRSCPLIILQSPPATVKVCNIACNNTTTVCRNCSQSFTLNTATTCQPFTWTFTNTTQSCTKVFVTSTASLTINNLPGANGDAFTLTITDSGGGSSPVYNMTGAVCP